MNDLIQPSSLMQQLILLMLERTKHLRQRDRSSHTGGGKVVVMVRSTRVVMMRVVVVHVRMRSRCSRRRRCRRDVMMMMVMVRHPARARARTAIRTRTEREGRRRTGTLTKDFTRATVPTTAWITTVHIHAGRTRRAGGPKHAARRGLRQEPMLNRLARSRPLRRTTALFLLRVATTVRRVTGLLRMNTRRVTTAQTPVELSGRTTTGERRMTARGPRT